MPTITAKSGLSGVYQRLVQEFRLWVTSAGPRVSPSTAERYGRIVRGFVKEFGHPAYATQATLNAWRTALNTTSRHGSPRSASASTINLKIAAMSAFYDFLVAEGVRPDNPIKGRIAMQRPPKRKPKFIPREDIKRLFETVYGTDETDITVQDRAILEVLYGSGLRRSEAAFLRLGAFVGRDRVRVIGKGDKERFTIVTEPEFRAVQTWALRKLGDDRSRELEADISRDAAFDDLRKRKADASLFYTAAGTPVPLLDDPGRFIWQRCLVYFTLAKVKATSHHWRHSFATGLLSGGADLFAVSQMLGHNDLNTTRIYLGMEDPLFERARLAHPRA